jgi:hypothetical protein
MIVRIEATLPKQPRDQNWDAWRRKRDAAVAEAREKVVDGELYFLCRHGGYFRPKAQGYTDCMSFAAVYSAAVARDYLDVEGLSVIPLSSVRDELEERVRRLVDEVASINTLIHTPELALSDPSS